MIKPKFLSVLVSMVLIISVFTSCQSDDIDTMVSYDNQPTVSETIDLPFGHSVQKVGDNYIWQGDILLSPRQMELLASTGTPFDSLVATGHKSLSLPATSGKTELAEVTCNSRSCAVYPNANLWTMVRFVYAPSGYANETQLAPSTKTIIQAALRHWEANTNVRFYNATGQPTHDDTYDFDYPYVYFCNGSANNSYIGRIGGKQVLHLVINQSSMGTAIHEIGHAIGLYHEQCRFDRDDYITINWNNIIAAKKDQFSKITKNYYCMGDFDFSSVMLYSSDAFAIDSSIPTMTKKDGSTFIGQRNGLSFIDRRFPNYFYLPYIARSDSYAELDTVMYDGYNQKLSREQILQIQAQINNGNPTPPANGRIPNDF